jgi:nitrous oxidase accessory protein
MLIAALAVTVMLASGRAAEAPPADAGPWLVAQLAAAKPGDIIEVPAGEYRGPFVIDRPLYLRARGQAFLIGDGRTHVVAVHAPDVTIEGFDIRNSGLDLAKDQAAIHITGARAVIRDNRISDSLHGIYVRQANGAHIEGNTITGKAWTIELVNPFAAPSASGSGETCEVPLTQDRRGNGIHIWNSTGHVIARNIIRNARDGIYFSFVDQSDVIANDIRNVRYGLHYMYSDDNRFRDNQFHENAAGAALMYSKGIVLERNVFAANRNQRAHGLLLYSVDESIVADNRIVGSTVGLFLEHSLSNTFRSNEITGNHVGIHITNSSDGNVFTENVFARNLHPVETSGETMANQWALAGRGNYWDAAVVLDLDANGVGDTPHRELDLFGAWRRPFPAVGLLSGSPAERLLRLVHARVAMPGMPGISDPAPLVRVRHP